MDGDAASQQQEEGRERRSSAPPGPPAELSALLLSARLRRLAAAVEATEAVAFTVERADGRPALRDLTHLGPADDPARKAAALSGLRKMGQRCLDSGKTRAAFAIDGAGGGLGMKFCLVGIIADPAGPRALLIALVARCRDREDVRRRLGLVCAAEFGF